MITTIQLRDGVKNQLQLLKKQNQTFEDVILGLLKGRESFRDKNLNLIESEAKELNDLNKKITNEVQDVEDIGGEIVEW